MPCLLPHPLVVLRVSSNSFPCSPCRPVATSAEVLHERDYLSIEGPPWFPEAPMFMNFEILCRPEFKRLIIVVLPIAPAAPVRAFDAVFSFPIPTGGIPGGTTAAMASLEGPAGDSSARIHACWAMARSVARLDGSAWIIPRVGFTWRGVLDPGFDIQVSTWLCSGGVLRTTREARPPGTHFSGLGR